MITTNFLRRLLALELGGLLVLAGCGGGAANVSNNTPPPTSYTVTATAGTGVAISPASTSVVAGSTATFTVSLLVGYQNPVAVGCTLTGTTCVTGAINANASVSASATLIPVTHYTVTATAGTGVAISPASTSVVAGSTATFTVSLLAGYQNPVAVGCTLTGTTCVTGAINANASVSASATLIPSTYSPKMTPFAFFENDPITTLVEVAVHETGVRVWVTPYTETLTGAKFEIKDDGKNGDLVAGDGIYSASYTWVGSANFYPSIYRGMIAQITFGISITSSIGVEVGSNFTHLGIVKKSQLVPTANVTTLAGGNITASPNAVFINVPYGTSQQNVTKALYEVFPDVFDGITLIDSWVTSASTQNYVSVRQPLILGIGSYPTFDNSSEYGSNGKLLGINNENGADGVLASFLHEDAGHMLGEFHLTAAACSGVDFTGGDGNHMNILADSNDLTSYESQQYLVKQTNGDYVVTSGDSSGGKLSPFSKYIVGTGKASDVPPLCAAFGYKGSTMPGTVVPGSAVTCYTIAQIQGLCGGVRSPDYATSQKAYRVLFAWQLEPVGNTPAVPTSAEVAFGNTIAAFYASNPLPTDTGILTFSGATGSGTLTTAVPAHK